MRDIVALFGPENVFVLSIDKAKVPVGVTAATKQASMIIHDIRNSFTRPSLRQGYKAQIDSISVSFL